MSFLLPSRPGDLNHAIGWRPATSDHRQHDSTHACRTHPFAELALHLQAVAPRCAHSQVHDRSSHVLLSVQIEPVHSLHHTHQQHLTSNRLKTSLSISSFCTDDLAAITAAAHTLSALLTSVAASHDVKRVEVPRT